MKVTVWNENQHEKEIPEILELYPGGIHCYLANMLKCDDIEVRTATLDDPECGLTQEVVDDTDVMIWWGHMAHIRRYGTDRTSLRSLLQDFPQTHGYYLQPEMERRRKGKNLDHQAKSSDCSRRSGNLCTGSGRNVRRNL